MNAHRIFATALLVSALTTPALAQEFSARFSMCGSHRHTCVVDGDTIWLQGVNLRLESFDTPEPHTNICGGAAEVALATRASARLLELLNSNSFTVRTSGTDRYGRVLATIRIAGRDIGDILIEEGLARRWPNGREWWC
ncbi:thermonuclease family protein [Devosia sp.]|uniref:thermonuclease family protein n=1 Tax=Devosia sp. TaxID=1871048 RepID=UPI0029318D37|nr:thermonuclease family protein [Devosia sp.]